MWMWIVVTLQADFVGLVTSKIKNTNKPRTSIAMLEWFPGMKISIISKIIKVRR